MVAPNRTGSGLSLIPEENSRNMPSSSKSTESLYSNTSSSKGSATILYRRNAPLGRHSVFIPATTEVRQRVLSARRLRMKTFQNQLADAQQHISELAHENRMLRTLHKRQDLALSKYESTNAELPQLLHSHAEEVRVWQMKYRNLQAQNKELLFKLKQKESLILSLGDQNKHLTQLNRDKNLEDRQRLTEKVQQLETRLQEKETDMKLLARRLQLETKNSKKELFSEQKRRKEALMQLEKVKQELSGYVKIDELNLNDKLTKLSIGSLSNITNGIHGYDERNNKSQTILTPLDKKSSDQSGDQSNRSLGTDRSDIFVNTGRTSRKLSGNKLIRTSTHRGGGDGPSEDDQLNFMKSVEIESTPESHTDLVSLDSKSEDNNFYDEDYEENEDDDDGDDGIENVREVRSKAYPVNWLTMFCCFQTPTSTSKIPILEKPSKTEDIHFIRKEINEDFKQRESFLNTFCRQTTNESAKININRKTKLLAALKAIDGGSSSQD
ncbi:lebercilin-like protein [Episyrphus balteatus]|uniref:lebercilin-like protein n=1 Tax=Episyrphus balteatus TaxID=286459 RepID=UPI002485518E|nr:lebercilin-like protein [Episyrphus balteatus]